MTATPVYNNIFEQTTTHMPRTSWQSWLTGRPLSTADSPHQTIGKLIGLAVFSSDALSSVAYGPQEILITLFAAGISGLKFALPVAVGIAVLLAILTFSYEQTIHAYPGGGGAYIVARDNLGFLPAQVAGAALLTDYVLTVSVSISSGVAQIISAFPNMDRFRIEIAVAMILFVMVINLRGVKDSGITFAIPTYFFLAMITLTVITGFVRYFTGTLGVLADPPSAEILSTQSVTLFLLLRAFSNGTSSVTGVEAISNGITAFKEPRSKNAGITLIWMAFILGTLLLAITFLATKIGAVPSEGETIISQIARTVLAQRGLLYILVLSSTTVILMMAANTAFADFPRLGALHAIDGFLPRQFAFRGSRLVYSYGIVALALISSLLVIYFKASVSTLIPLYAIGVFLSFTLSQAGMAHRWWKSGHLQPGEEVKELGSILRREKSWQFKMIVNGIGAVCTFIVMIVFAVTKFKEGAYIVIILIPLLVTIFVMIHRHYTGLATQLTLESYNDNKRITRNRVIMPIAGVHRGTLEALSFAATISPDVTAVHIAIDDLEVAKLKEKWSVWGNGARLVILHSPYRLFIEPLLSYIDCLDEVSLPNELITIVVPQFVPKSQIANLLHARTADTLRKALLNRRNIVITEVPYQVG